MASLFSLSVVELPAGMDILVFLSIFLNSGDSF